MTLANSSPCSFSLASGLGAIALSEIGGEHPVVENIRQRHSLPPLDPACPATILPSGLLNFLSRHPLDVIWSRKQYFCFGNLRRYRWLKSCNFAPETKVDVRIYPRMAIERIAEHVLADLLIDPAFLGFGNRDIHRAGILWEALKSEAPFRSLFRAAGKKALAELLDVDPRRFKPKDAKRSD
jgi:hypothetical protein